MVEPFNPDFFEVIHCEAHLELVFGVCCVYGCVKGVKGRGSVVLGEGQSVLSTVTPNTRVRLIMLRDDIVTLWQQLGDKPFRRPHISITIFSARHFIASLEFFFYCSSRCSRGYHQRDLCKLIIAKESPELNKHIQAGNGPGLLL